MVLWYQKITRRRESNGVKKGCDTDFDHVIFSDECTVQLESHRRITIYKKGQPIQYKVNAKHPPKVNVWAGISSHGVTKVVVFIGMLTATCYVDILEADLKAGIKSFWASVTPETCKKYVSHSKEVIPKVIEANGGLLTNYLHPIHVYGCENLLCCLHMRCFILFMYQYQQIRSLVKKTMSVQH